MPDAVDSHLNRRARRAAGRADAHERAHALVGRLEHAIAETGDRREVMLKAADHAVVVENHRDHHAYHLGADGFYCGLASGDATALMGLMSTGPANVSRLLAEAAVTQPTTYVTRLWPAILDADRDEYEARGRFVSWRRRWAAYKEKADGWLASELNTADGHWRELHMTSGQRHLVQDTAAMLDLDIPPGLDRGAAHDWLHEHGANMIYRKGA